MTERFSCSRASLAAAEPLFATASSVQRWILVEQPGPWGRDAVAESQLPPTVASALAVRARRAGARVLLVRRHGRYAPVGRTCYAALTTVGSSWVEEFRVEQSEDLLDIDFAPLGRGASLGGRRLEHPLYLVCTNGRHDPCCAEFGRPLAAVLAGAFPDRVWESSHFGGDRFAGNLVCLPQGLYYGHVGPEDGPRIVARNERGLLDLDHLRGRSCYSFAVQAADHLARRRLGLTGIDDLVAVGSTGLGAGRTRVTFDAAAGGRYLVEVESRPSAEPARLTCHGGPSCPPRHRLLNLDHRED